MKTNKSIILLLTLSIVLFNSCDSNKGKVKDLADQFVTAYNEADKASIIDLFPTFKSYDNLSISGTIGQGDDISVEKNDSGIYIATINEQKQQQLLFSVDSIGNIYVKDTYGIFRLDSTANELALKSGVPVKKLSDTEIAKLMNPEGDFINDLKQTKNTDFLISNNGGYSWSRTSSGFTMNMNFTIRNNSSQTVNGKDYYIIITPKQRSTGNTYNTKTVDGVDISANEIREFNVNEPSLYNIASQRDLQYSIEVKYRSESILAFLLNYGDFQGNEYEDFLAHPYRAKLKVDGVYGMVKAKNEAFAYAYKEMSEKSTIVDTLYHRKGIILIWESASWASVFNYDDELIGYMKIEDLDTTREEPELELTEKKLKSSTGKVNVYDDSEDAPKDKVVKTVSAGNKVLLEIQEFGDITLYERQPNGSVKRIGRIDTENVDYDDEE